MIKMIILKYIIEVVTRILAAHYTYWQLQTITTYFKYIINNLTTDSLKT